MTSATDNQTTKLRKMLDERGVEYEARDGNGYMHTYWTTQKGAFSYFARESERMYGTDKLLLETTGLTKSALAVTAEQAIAATLESDGITEDSIDKWLREFQIAHGELVHIGSDELKDLAYALHDDIPLGYEASMRLSQWLLHATLGSRTCRLELEPNSDRLWWCSNCHSYHEHVSNYPWEHCPRCGAKAVSE